MHLTLPDEALFVDGRAGHSDIDFTQFQAPLVFGPGPLGRQAEAQSAVDPGSAGEGLHRRGEQFGEAAEIEAGEAERAAEVQVRRDLQPVQVDLQRRVVDPPLEAETGALGAGRGAEPLQRGRVDDQVELQFRGFQADHAVGQAHLADEHGPGRGGGRALLHHHCAGARAGHIGGVAPAAVGQLFEVKGRLLVDGPPHVHPFFEQGGEVQVEGEQRVAEHLLPFALDLHAVDGEPAGEQVGGEGTDTGGVGAVLDEPVLQSLLQADGQQQREQDDTQGQGGEHPDPGFAKERRDPGAHDLQVGVHRRGSVVGKGGGDVGRLPHGRSGRRDRPCAGNVLRIPDGGGFVKPPRLFEAGLWP